jgi:hypothetical protein
MRNVIQIILVLAMMATAAGIIVHAVLKIRFAAKKMACGNNLRTLADTLDMFRTTNGVYPAGTVQDTGLPPEERLSWLVTIWPYIQAGPSLRLNPAESWKSTANYPPFKDYFGKTHEPAHPVGHMKLFQCPGSLQPPEPEECSVNHYIGLAGVGQDAASLPIGAPGIGFFGYDRVLKKSDVTDGLSNTIAVIETLRDAGPWTAGGSPTVRGLSEPSRTPYFGPDGQWHSNHERLLALFADGSIRNLTEKIDPSVLEALATIAGGEDVSPP